MAVGRQRKLVYLERSSVFDKRCQATSVAYKLCRRGFVKLYFRPAVEELRKQTKFSYLCCVHLFENNLVSICSLLI